MNPQQGILYEAPEGQQKYAVKIGEGRLNNVAAVQRDGRMKNIPPKLDNAEKGHNVYVSVKETLPSPTSPTEAIDPFREEVASLCNASPGDIEEIYACTPLQEAMMALTVKSPTAYTMMHEYRLPPGTDPVRLQEACDQAAQANPALRTRIATTQSHGCVQAVLRGTVAWGVCSEDDDALPVNMQPVAWRMGGQLAYFTMNLTRHILRVCLHHSISDAWSIALLLRQVEAAYRGEELVFRPFRPLVEYIEATRDRAEAFWKAELKDAHLDSMATYPALPSPGYTADPSESVCRTFPIQSMTSGGFPVNTKLRLAWAVLQSLYTGSDDILFGAINVGRSVPVPGVEDMVGPAITSVPVRIQLCTGWTIAKTLEMVQEQWARSMELEHVGLQNLLHMGSGPEAACRFQTLMSVEPGTGTQLPGLFMPYDASQRAQELYPLVLQCRPSDTTMEVEALVDPGVISVRQAERLLGQLSYIYEQIENDPAITLAEIDPVSREDRAELIGRNISRNPASVPPCVHDMISERARSQPHAAAISAWDGDLSYQELDDLSSGLAARLSRFNIRPGVFVPVLVEKSKWVPVAMIAVMKAGGAFVLFDRSFPIQRLQQMGRVLKATVGLTSEAQADVAAQLGLPTMLSVDRPAEDPDSQRRAGGPSPVTSHDDPMYVTFTSGSTGTPKGVIVNHAGYAATALAHGEPYHFTPESRVLQFASPAFDSCIIEHLSVLIMGSCVCIPTASDCLSNPAEAIDRFRVNVACLTPSVSRIVAPDRLPGLQVLAFVGEAVLASDVARWKPYVQVRNAYGPAECSAVFSVLPQLQEHDPTNIGFPTGSVGWVVHPQDQEKLMPMGCPGELLIEGPTVGPGYLSNPEQTSRAYVQAPTWRQTFDSSTPGALYKTGDLVECTGDGSFRYLGRKDTQVKLHGQRLELGEVEHHVCQSFPGAKQAVVEMLQSSPSQDDPRPKNLLTAFVCVPEAASSRNPESLFLPATDRFRAACATAEARLTEVLPAFMVPRVTLPIKSVPLTPSGKTNRRLLRDQAASLSWAMMQNYRAVAGHQQRPSNACEEELRQIWAQSLNRPVDQISTSVSFFRLGGDSVSAMQAANNCRMAGWSVTVGDIFRYPTISKLAQRMQEIGKPQHLAPTFQEDPTDKPFRLSPIQQMLFEYDPRGNTRFTQHFLLRITQPTSSSKVREAMQAIVARHSMLRARFRRIKDGQWDQLISSNADGSVLFGEHFLSSLDDQETLRRILDGSQGQLDIQHGPLIAVDLITTEAQEQYLGIMAHHLVIDLVSWRVVLQDLEDILTTGTPLQPPSIPFQRWCQLQQSYSQESLDPRKALPSEIPCPPRDYWGLGDTQSTWGDAVQETIRISQDATQALLGLANDAFHTRPVEVIQTAVLHSFVNVFDDRQAPAIFNEGHGREPWNANIDISRTVGWFTTLVPLFIDARKGQEITEMLLLTKSGRRAIPSNGWEYFASRYLHPDGPSHCQGHAPMEILFNYTGLFQQLERQDALLQLAALPDHDILPLPSDLPRFAVIDVSATVANGAFNLTFMYPRQMRHQDRVHQWVQACQSTLEALPQQLQNHCYVTASDFGLLSVDDEELEMIVQDVVTRTRAGISEIEDIYPCSPVQLDIWLSQLKAPGRYWSRLQWLVEATDKGRAHVDINKVRDAWQQVVDRHSILRTIFIEDGARQGKLVQVVLRTLAADIQVIAAHDLGMDDNASRQRRLTQDGRPLHQLALVPNEDGNVSCQLIIHHVLMDGGTGDLLIDELHQAYDGLLDGQPAPSYSAYIGYLQQRGDQADKYWMNYLSGANSCLFPPLQATEHGEKQVTPHIASFTFPNGDQLRSYCRDRDFTISSLLHVAWGLVLRIYTGSDDVVFGCLSSGRDIPLQQVHEIAGPLISLLVCRLTLGDDVELLAALRDNQVAYANGVDNQQYSLAEAMHSLDLSGQPLFNTAMSLQNEVPDQARGGSSDIAIKDDGGSDSTEYDIAVNLTINTPSIDGNLTYYSDIISDTQAELIADTFQSIVMQLIDPANTQIGHLDLLGPKNKDRIFEWNQKLPDPVSGCVHRAIQDYSMAHPQTPAVAAWDNNLTYGELDRSSSCWAQHLIHHGVGPETFVPVYCDRSSWTIVAVLAILKAGGAFILLDQTHPKERLKDMLQNDFSCPVIVTSAKHAAAAAFIAPKPIVIEDMQRQPVPGAVPLAAVRPTCAGYAIFTSGSTGRPKGCVIEHRSFYCAIEAQREAFGIDDRSRVLHFSSYAFDVCIIEIFATLLAGGCICIPTEDGRQRIEDTIEKFQITWAILVTSIARTLDPRRVSPLETLVLAGEKVSRHDVRRWAPHVHLVNGYGPAECSMISTSQSRSEILLSDSANIGWPVGGGAWVMSPANPHQPLPVGAIGELLIDGPIVGRGYVNRSEQTAAVFLSYPDWMKAMRGTGRNALYRTGDLVRQLPDGSIRYIGRRDRQVKLRGQRIELAEVEYHVQRCFPGGSLDVFVDLVVPDTSTTTYLVASIATQKYSDDETFERNVELTKARLVKEVPVFFIPNAFIPLHEIPRLVNGKVDRQKVHRLASQALVSQMNQPTKDPVEWNPGSLTSDEQTMQSLWAEVLQCSPKTIGPDDNFFLLGGDSIAAMRLTSAAGARGLKLAVPQVFLHPQMRDLAQALSCNAKQLSSGGLTKSATLPEPLSLLPPGKRSEAHSQAMSQCDISSSKIENIYPCTPWQTTILGLAAAVQMTQHRLRVAPHIDADRLKAAWQTVVAGEPILRTRMIEVAGLGYLQVVTKHDGIRWSVSASTQRSPPHGRNWLGSPLLGFELYSPGRGRPVDLVISVHHALIDPHSLSQTLSKVQAAYEGSPVELSVGLGDLMTYIASQKEAALDYWREGLRDVDIDPFPSLPSQHTKPQTMKKMQSVVDIKHLGATCDFSMAIRLAWGLVHSQYQGTTDVVFGVRSNGRKANVNGIKSMVAPATTIIPFRLSINHDATVAEALSELEVVETDLVQFEQVTLSEIAALSPEAKQASSFQTLLAIERDEDKVGTRLEWTKHRAPEDLLHVYALQIVASVEGKDIIIKAAFDNSAISEWLMQHVMDQFSHMLKQVLFQPERLVGHITTVNPNDLLEMQRWNPDIPPKASGSVADVIYEQSIERPFAPAVCAWDGDFSYEELDVEASNLASVLRHHGVGPETFVPICMEPSRWVVVAILAVLKARAAILLLDLSHPLARLQTICSDIDAPVVIASGSTKLTAQSLARMVVSLDGSIGANTTPEADINLIQGEPHHALYVVFTSGSTGKPKGVIIENGSFLTMAVSFMQKTGFGPHSRMLQLSSYAFDVSMLEFMAPLIAGACLCIPSTAERKDGVAESVQNLQPSHMVVTPARLRALTPAEMNPVHTVMLIGETVRASDIEEWSKDMRVINMYGPAECTVLFTMQRAVSPARAANIGAPVAGAAWISDQQNPERPVPIGAVGELLLQGPLVGRGYHKSPEQTAAAFIPCPQWIQNLSSGRHSTAQPVYRTGDLVRYEADGSFHFIGRRDFQVKLRSQRFELGEVEEQVQQVLPGRFSDVLALLATPSAAVQTQCLVVFLVPKEAGLKSRVAPSPVPPLPVVSTAELVEDIALTNQRLKEALPGYMMPSAFVPLECLPRTSGGKTDRKQLQQAMATMTRQQMDAFAPRIVEDMAGHTSTERFHGVQVPIINTNVEAVYPCTPAQRGILLSQLENPNIYCPHFIWRIRAPSGATVDIDRLQDAWRQVVTRHPALRAAFRPTPSGDGQFEQILLRKVEPPLTIFEGEYESSGLKPPPIIANVSKTVTLQDGQSVQHHMTMCTSVAGYVFCRLDVNHAIIDTISTSLIERDLCQAYDLCLPTDSPNDAYQGYLEFVHQQPMKPAQQYWHSYLESYKPCQLPLKGSQHAHEGAETLKNFEVFFEASGAKVRSFCDESDWTPSSVMYLAWALTLKAFTGADDVCFGTFSSGRMVPVPGINEAVGQFANLSVCRVRFTRNETLDEAALRLLEEYYHILSYQSFPLSSIAKSAGLAIEDVASTAINVHYVPDAEPEDESSVRVESLHTHDPATHDLTCYIALQYHGQIKLLINYHPSRVAPALVAQLAEYFELAINRIVGNPQARVNDMELFTDHDEQRLRKWNLPCAEAPAVTVPHIVAQQAKQHPHHMAVSGWDGDFTYGELEQVSTRVADMLSHRAEIAGHPIPICFEKSKWTIVAILGIMKAGGTVVPLDPNEPLERLQDITRRIRPPLVVSSVAQAQLSGILAEDVIQIDEKVALQGSGKGNPGSRLPALDPDQAAYIMFTSGTSGAPKGVMVSHRSYATAAAGHIRSFGLTNESRVLQLASYAFDVSMMDILTTLIAGASIAVISESQRNQMIVTGTSPASVSHMFLTPSQLSPLDATRSSWVQTIVLLGEPMSDSHLRMWGNSCRLLNGYGPTECAVISTVSPPLNPTDDVRNIGWGVGVNCWIVDQNDAEKLMPIGARGELLLHGPSVGQGYLDEADKTAKAFIQPPRWLQDLYPDQVASGNLYKTGDIVRYEITDGSLRFEGRKDRQIKVNGQRVELAEIEHHVRQCFTHSREVVVEQARVPSLGVVDSSAMGALGVIPRLVACIWDGVEGEGMIHDANAEVDKQPILRTQTHEFQVNISAALGKLRKRLPGYMVPDLFVPLAQIPRTTSGKMDRAGLRECIQGISSQEWRAYTEMQRRKQPVKGEKAVRFHAILTSLLDIPGEEVGADDSFLHFGGDSILAMKIAARARTEGLEIQSGDILRHPTIREWAQIACPVGKPSHASTDHDSYSLVNDTVRTSALASYSDQSESLTPNDVIDILPTVEFQAFHIKNTTLVHMVEMFRTPVDLTRLKRACAEVVSHYSMLRSVFIPVEGHIYQVILRSVQPKIQQVQCENLEAYITQATQAKPVPMSIQQQSSVQFTVITSRTQADWAFMISLSHGQCDGASLPVLWQSISDAYNGHQLLQTTDFRDVVYQRLSEDHSPALSFWREYLSGAPLPGIEVAGHFNTQGSGKHTAVSRDIGRFTLPADVTMATLVHSSLAWILCQHANRRDVILTQVVHGRGGSLPGMDKVIGPCANYLPMRFRTDPQWTVGDLLHHVQRQRLETAPYDHVAFGEIVRQCTQWPEDTTYGCIVNHQVVASSSGVDLDGTRSASRTYWSTGRSDNEELLAGQMAVTSIERDTGVELCITAVGGVMDEATAERLVGQVAEAMRLFVESPDGCLSDLAAHGSAAKNQAACIPRRPFTTHPN
ncbi:amino acid adenylation [Aspergillus sclerotioniger CBS 115572]|uniref:Amino acid adenylation n=1 Tax=Aspergillus sclerotioniger CBS 115572 TaxID=1450535 RepID=A0A317X072_9EURO|nr:amino acid adenylation [Aspergillus sclerotioniger CBS 115572]PWY91675.1 amino acid adenylation [Aspergillus sclerotioniger CBS 115572]